MTVCPTCGIPLDASIFDDSRVFQIPAPTPGGSVESPLDIGESLELARFELPPEHCGVLLYFAQFTDRYAADPQNVLTPGYEWALLSNGHPLMPWLTFNRIINPWGQAGSPLALRLDAECILSFVIRNTRTASDPVLGQVGGRIVGRFWFDHAHAGPRALRTRQPW